VTIFEILVGRTPFEEVEGEQFQTKEDLERYWQRTVKGKWLGTWKFSRGKFYAVPSFISRAFSMESSAEKLWFFQMRCQRPNMKFQVLRSC